MTNTRPPEWDSWVTEGARLLVAPPLRRSEWATRGPEDRKFALGDLLCLIPEDLMEEFAEALKEAKSTVRLYRDVARKIPPHARVEAAWSVHRDLRDAPELLRPGLTVREVTALVGKKPIDSKAAHRRTVGEKAEDVRALLADPDVIAVIESEVSRSRKERKFQHTARNLISERAAQAKDLEAELRAARNAKSPFVATTKALVELNTAAQLAEAIGDIISDLDQQDRLAEGLRTLIDAAAYALEKCTARDSSRVIVGEVWQDRPEVYGSAESTQR